MDGSEQELNTVMLFLFVEDAQEGKLLFLAQTYLLIQTQPAPPAGWRAARSSSGFQTEPSSNRDDDDDTDKY